MDDISPLQELYLTSVSDVLFGALLMSAPLVMHEFVTFVTALGLANEIPIHLAALASEITKVEKRDEEFKASLKTRQVFPTVIRTGQVIEAEPFAPHTGRLFSQDPFARQRTRVQPPSRPVNIPSFVTPRAPEPLPVPLPVPLPLPSTRQPHGWVGWGTNAKLLLSGVMVLAFVISAMNPEHASMEAMIMMMATATQLLTSIPAYSLSSRTFRWGINGMKIVALLLMVFFVQRVFHTQAQAVANDMQNQGATVASQTLLEMYAPAVVVQAFGAAGAAMRTVGGQTVGRLFAIAARDGVRSMGVAREMAISMGAYAGLATAASVRRFSSRRSVQLASWVVTAGLYQFLLRGRGDVTLGLVAVPVAAQAVLSFLQPRGDVAFVGGMTINAFANMSAYAHTSTTLASAAMLGSISVDYLGYLVSRVVAPRHPRSADALMGFLHPAVHHGTMVAASMGMAIPLTTMEQDLVRGIEESRLGEYPRMMQLFRITRDSWAQMRTGAYDFDNAVRMAHGERVHPLPHAEEVSRMQYCQRARTRVEGLGRFGPRNVEAATWQELQACADGAGAGADRSVVLTGPNLRAWNDLDTAEIVREDPANPNIANFDLVQPYAVEALATARGLHEQPRPWLFGASTTHVNRVVLELGHMGVISSNLA